MLWYIDSVLCIHGKDRNTHCRASFYFSLYIKRNETWPCIYEAVIERGSPNVKRNGKGPEWNQYSMNSTQLLIILNETQHVIDKYSGPEWADDPIAQELVVVSTEYQTENLAEFNIVMNQEQNCNPNPCANDGVCEEGQNEWQFWYSHRCVCPLGWAGPFCEVDIDECIDNNSCLNGATCVDQPPPANGYVCECAQGWEGLHCEHNIDECLKFPCQNGATCTDSVNHLDYTCTCVPGFSGDNCEIK